MDENEDIEICCQTSLSSDNGNLPNAESQSINVSNESSSKSSNCDMNQCGDAEELDFEDEQLDSNSPKFTDITTSANQKLPPEELSERLEQTRLVQETVESACNLTGSETVEATSEKSSVGDKIKCSSEGEIEEGEATDDNESGEVEDGEIDDKLKPDSTQRNACRFYQRGKCAWGSECHYLHLTDKGLYHMFDLPAITRFAHPPPSFVHKVNPLCHTPWEPPNKPESIWDRALDEAKERVQQSRIKKEESFEEKLYMTVENDDRFVDNYDYSRDRHILPGSFPKRQIRDYSPQHDYNRRHKQNSKNGNEEPKLVRKTYGSKTDYNLQWRDPWRRSKTPPHRKKCPSKPSSDLSKSSRSRSNSQSSWTSRSCQSSGSERKRIKSQRKRSRTRSCKGFHKRSLKSRSRSASWSRSGSTSCSCLSSSESNSREAGGRRKKRRLSTPRHGNRKRNISASPESIILPYKRRSRSLSQPRKIVQLHKTGITDQSRGFAKKNYSYKSRSRSPDISSKTRLFTKERGSSNNTISRRSRSPKTISNVKHAVPQRSLSKVVSYSPISKSVSTSSRSSAKRELSDSDSSDQSGSDMSISPVSDSSPKIGSSYSDKNFPRKSRSRHSEVPKYRSDAGRICNPTNLSSGGDNVPRGSVTSHSKSAGRIIASGSSEIGPQRKAGQRINTLETELLKYVGGLKRGGMRSAQATPKQTDAAAKDVKSSSSVNPKCGKVTSVGVSESASSKSNMGVRGKLSKREMLIEQLKAVEEAIAKKKKFCLKES